MATVSASSLPLSPPSSSPPRRKLSKVLTGGRRRSSDVQSENAVPSVRGSVDSVGIVKSPSLQSQRSQSREGSVRSSASSGVKKLLPGHSKRERKRVREEELLRIANEEAARGRQPAGDADQTHSTGTETIPRPALPNRSHSSLVTVDSEVESPPATASRDLYTGFLSTASPLINTSAVEQPHSKNVSTEKFPSIIEPQPMPISAPTSPKSPALTQVPVLPALANLTEGSDSLRPATDTNRARAKSPGRRFKDVFSRGGKSPRVSPERRESETPQAVPATDGTGLQKSNTGFGEKRRSNNPEARGPSPLRAQTIASDQAPKSAMPILQTEPSVPTTPPGAILHHPTTTITPPTPTDPESRNSLQSPRKPDYAGSSWPEQNTSPVQSNGHRRVRSLSGATHQKSKLSTSMVAPLTPTVEEQKTPTSNAGTPGSKAAGVSGSFFSSWVSAAQNAATSITNLTNQNRARAGTSSSNSDKPKPPDTPSCDKEKDESASSLQETSVEPKKALAIDTIGSGDLNLGHLGIEDKSDRRAPSPSRSDYAPSVREDMAAKMEDLLAKRAVSQAYERPGKSGEAIPVAEIPDPVGTIRPSSTFDTAGTLTPPNGSIFEGETTGVKRTNSVRSKLHNRRSRGSSVTTAQSAIGAMIGASTATLANPASGPKLSGFAIAPKQRNRAFHQQFRSVPEDDFLIEDYSCALQKEILLAGRIYISEGHICFSSNILGWVTTLIISFEEIVSIEKENTAIVIPNAIAVQTLHARHTFRSLLSREATYDLMIGIWRVSHPDSFQKSMNGQKLAAGVVSNDNIATTAEDGEGLGSEETSDASGSGSDDDAESDASDSLGEEEFQEAKSLTRKPSGKEDTGLGATMAAAAAPATGDATNAVTPIVAAGEGVQDFPGPATHPPTECTDAATHYDKIIKDEVIQAPLGKIYSLLYGAQSGTFVKKFLVEGMSKAQDLQLDEKDKLDNDTKTRKYQYIKPLGGSIGPKQTTCITTENLDFFDLEKAISVSCTTQTPDVPSGSAFSTKTRYCLTWAPGNATRFQMNMTIEWTAKSWLKTPIEKGALDGQQGYGDDLVKTLKAALGRSRATTAGSKKLNNGKKKRKSSKRDKGDSPQAEPKKEENWGPLDFLRPTLDPIVAPVRPFVRINVVVTIISIMVIWMWFRGAGSSSAISRGGVADRTLYYDELWRREEHDLWEWLQDRAGIDGTVLREALKESPSNEKESKEKVKQRQKLLKSKDMQARLREEKKSMKEMEESVRVTQERLESLQRALKRQEDVEH